MDLQAITERVATVVGEVSEYQLDEFRKHAPGAGREKQLKEYVSQIDVQSEEMLRKGLGEIISEAGFYGEETLRERVDAATWVVDPLDGTTNYLSGFEEWSISVALVCNRRLELGYVCKPFYGEVYSATRGGGAV